MPTYARASRLIAALGLVSLLSAPIGPATARSKPIVKPAPVDENGPVRCQYGGGYDNVIVTGQRMKRNGNGSMPIPAPPPQVAPMPSPSVSKVAPSGAVMGDIGRASMPRPYPMPQVENRERYTGKDVASIKSTATEPVSTFSVDVDTGSYANVRRFLTQGQTPPSEAVRTEEMLNYFRYDYPVPKDRSRPFSVTADMAKTPWNPNTTLLRVGIKGFDLPRSERPPTNLVFLVDVSGSMFSQDKLPLVKTSLSMLADRLGPNDRVSIVVYAGAAGIVLEPTNQARFVKQALDCLQAGGSTAGGQGMELAYATARANFVRGGVNRVIMATDGDFNVGISSNDGIEAIVKKNRESGITLTTLGFGQGNYNEAMMEKVADIGNGNYAYIDTALEAQKVLDEEMAATIFTIAKDVKVQLEFDPAVVKEYRLIGYENRILAEEDFNNDKVDAGDIGSGHQVTALYEIVTAGRPGWLPERRYEANKGSVKPVIALPPREVGWLKLRYKLPNGDTSMLIEQPINYALFERASQPTGDMAFAAAVAAFGQKLRGDKYLGAFSFADVRKLAGDQRGYLREEFLKLTSLASAQQVASRVD
jgi:Ca-activated chloride channel homolog